MNGKQSTATGAALGLLLTLPLLGAVNLLHETVGHHYVPVELIHSGLGLVLMDAILFAEPLALSLPLLLWGVGICVVGYRRAVRAGRAPGPWIGVGVGWLFGAPLLLALPWLAERPGEIVAGLAILGLIFGLWGLLYTSGVTWALVLQGHTQGRAEGYTGGRPWALPNLTRRQILGRGVGAVLALTGGMALGTAFLHNRRRSRLAAQMRLPDHIPAQLVARVYRADAGSGQAFQFPEMAHERYQPARHPVGVAFSGGGPRAMCCALGQMRGLHAAGLLPRIGAVSCVSGGGWFGTIFTYAPTAIRDEDLLGAYVAPEDLRVEALAAVPPSLAAAPLTGMTDSAMLRQARNILRGMSITDSPFNRFWARLLNESLLRPFDLADHHRFFTLDQASVRTIGQRNPALGADHFYTARPDRPYLICSSSHAWPPGPEQVLRHFTFTPLYAGMQQFFPGSGVDASDLGGGFIESFAFDSQHPLALTDPDLVTVATPEPLFALCDMVGATSAAAGLMLNHYRQPHFMTQFHQWPLDSGDRTGLYSIVDGSGIDNAGIVPLLRRGYPVIVAFINAAIPLGDPGDAAVRGLSSEISRLFGLNPPMDAARDPAASQVFPTAQFAPLADGLKAAHAAGQTPTFVDQYEIVQPNAFGIAPYPHDTRGGGAAGTVTVVWVYNERNASWIERLPPAVQRLLTQTDPTNRLDNFPHFGTVAQNESAAGVPQLLYYSPQQVHLLAHMWSYNVVTDVVGDVLPLMN